MNELSYPSDLTAAQWALIEPLIPAPKAKGRKRKVDLRKITNAILYVLKGGVSWRMLPREFAPWKTVYHYFRLWRLAGLWDRVHDQLRDQVRISKGRHICPSAAIVDSQSVATEQKGEIGATMLRSAPRVISGISWSMYFWVCVAGRALNQKCHFPRSGSQGQSVGACGGRLETGRTKRSGCFSIHRRVGSNLCQRKRGRVRPLWDQIETTKLASGIEALDCARSHWCWQKMNDKGAVLTCASGNCEIDYLIPLE